MGSLGSALRESPALLSISLDVMKSVSKPHNKNVGTTVTWTDKCSPRIRVELPKPLVFICI